MSGIQPTLTIRPGFAMRVMVSKDLILWPYQPLFFQRGHRNECFETWAPSRAAAQG